MRDRLIELLDECRGIDGIGMELVEKQAGHLLDNGVIVLPCKVGDTVYHIVDMDNPARIMLESEVIDISITETKIKFQTRTFKKYLYRYGFYEIGDFGKTIFLTKEQAEKALAEAANGT